MTRDSKMETSHIAFFVACAALLVSAASASDRDLLREATSLQIQETKLAIEVRKLNIEKLRRELEEQKQEK